jgi:hypothetical protein
LIDPKKQIVNRLRHIPLRSATGFIKRRPLDGGQGSGVTFKIIGNATGSGKYNIKTFTAPASDISPTTDLVESDFGTLATDVDGLLLNGPELGVSNTGHDVTASPNGGKFALYGRGDWVSTNADGLKIIVGNVFWVGCLDDD